MGDFCISKKPSTVPLTQISRNTSQNPPKAESRDKSSVVYSGSFESNRQKRGKIYHCALHRSFDVMFCKCENAERVHFLFDHSSVAFKFIRERFGFFKVETDMFELGQAGLDRVR